MNARRLLGKALALTVIAVCTTGLLATPASADSVQTFQESNGNTNFPKCIDSHGAGTHAAKTYRCNGKNYQKWTVHSIREPRAHLGTVVTLKNVANGTCLDSHGSGATIVQVRPCNGGDYQKWEVFYSPYDLNYYRFKSWGAFTAAGKHTCIEHDSEWDAAFHDMHMGDCDDAHNLSHSYWH